MSLTLEAPAGSHFDFDEVKTKGGSQSLGEVPILIWDDVNAAVGHYTEDGVKNILDGTSLRVSFQGIARRMRIAGKSDDEIADAMLKFRPGQRQVGAATPASRAARSAKQAAEKVDGDTIAAFLKKVAEGGISEEDLASLTG